MKSPDYEEWVNGARQQTQERMSAAQQQFGLGGHARYEIDLASATIRFFNADDIEEVRADIQVAGSWSPVSASWLWGWENASVPAAASSRTALVHELGETNDVAQLRTSFSPCEEAEAWSMAAIAAQALDAECVYRAPGAMNQ